jgi:hypothetical protein
MRLTGWRTHEVQGLHNAVKTLADLVSGYEKRQEYVQDLMRRYVIAAASAAIERQKLIAMQGLNYQVMYEMLDPQKV